MLATMHGKERVIAPIMRKAFGMSVTVPPNFNTDTFGTFTRTVPRAGTQLKAARAKARAALTATGATLALASEGSFGVHPALPFVPSNLEIVLLLDTLHNLEIVGHFRSGSPSAGGATVRSVEELRATAEAWGFPEYGVIVRASESSRRHLHTELITWSALETTAQTLFKKMFVRSLWIERDLRAHRNPQRMKHIAAAAEDLVQNCLHVCPQCSAPGFVVHTTHPGLPCTQCGQPTERIQTLERRCQRCHHSHLESVEQKSADPADCGYCNP